MSALAPYLAAMTALFLAAAGGGQVHHWWDLHLEYVATGREIAARMDMPLPAARAELAEPAPPYIAPVLGVRIGTRHPEPVQHITYEPRHFSPVVAATPADYAGWHRADLVGVTAEFDRIMAAEFPIHQPSYVEV